MCLCLSLYLSTCTNGGGGCRLEDIRVQNIRQTAKQLSLRVYKKKSLSWPPRWPGGFWSPAWGTMGGRTIE